MPVGTSEKQQLFKYVLITFIGFMIIDTIIKFYFLYFINFETNTFSIISFILPYVILVVIAVRFYQYNKTIATEHRNSSTHNCEKAVFQFAGRSKLPGSKCGVRINISEMV